ncbi:MAG: hypothetical protein ATN32_00935 [Candidatus Epulonipiscium fishelsonii]|nr:MAG: hypothetical protein ATN32_00935 [Epulopiscium sp. AS2M-Bin002]
MENYSVLMSVYYKEKPIYLQESLDSMLHQTISPDEIVLVRDGPLTPDLNIVLQAYTNKYKNIKIIKLKRNIELARALNIGLKHCKNELVARMDTDDISKPERCETQLKFLEEHPNIDMIGSYAAEFSKSIEEIENIKTVPQTYLEIVKFIKTRNPFNHPSVMYKKSKVLSIGGYKHFRGFEDYYLWIKMINNGLVVANIKKVLIYMRTTEEMFKRRGGVSYFKDMLTLAKYLKMKNLMSTLEFYRFITLRGIVILMPNTLRALFYKIFLRQ